MKFKNLEDKVYSKRRNKTYEEIYGTDKALEIKAKQSLKLTGRKMGAMSTEQKEKLSIIHKNNWATGKEKLNAGNFKKGRIVSVEERKQKSLAHKGHKNYNIEMKGCFKKGHQPSEESKNKFRASISLNAKTNPNFGMKNKKHTEEAKEKNRLAHIGKKHSEKWKEWRRNHVFPIKDTQIEIKIQNFLQQLNIDFFTHKYIKEIEHGYQCDILIPAMKMVIECDGDYWHKYPVGRDIDKIRTSELLEKGFKVLRLWEYEIKRMDINNFKAILETSK